MGEFDLVQEIEKGPGKYERWIRGLADYTEYAMVKWWERIRQIWGGKKK